MLTVKDPSGIERPHYSMLLGGSVGAETGAVGQRLPGKFAEADVPKGIAALADFYRSERQKGEPFGAFVTRVGRDRMVKVSRSTGVEPQ